MVSDSELIGRLREFLSTSDLDTTTTAIVRRRLEEDFGIDLSDRKAFIREQVDIYLQSQFENADDNEDASNGKGDIDECVGEIMEEEGDVEEEEEEEEEVDEKEEESSNTAATGKSSTKKRKKEVKKRGGGFAKLCKLSPELEKFTGVPELARTEVVKQLWSYIRENNLQDPSNRRNIICDDTLRSLFGVDSIDMFQMNKALTKHIWQIDSSGEQARYFEGLGSELLHLLLGALRLLSVKFFCQVAKSPDGNGGIYSGNMFFSNQNQPMGNWINNR